MKLTPDDIESKLINEYKQEMLRTVGKERAFLYVVRYTNGWFVVRKNGSLITRVRQDDFVQMIARLKERPTKETA